MKLLTLLTLYAAALSAAFTAAPRLTAIALELAGLALFFRLWWLFATYAERDCDPFASRKGRR